MTIEKLQSFRPTAQTVEATETALRRIDTERRETESRIDAMTRARAGLLLSGSAAEIVAIDASAAKTRVYGEQLCALAAALAERLPAIKLAERQGQFDREQGALSPRHAAIRKALLEDYPVHATAIAQILQNMEDYNNQAQELFAKFSDVIGIRTTAPVSFGYYTSQRRGGDMLPLTAAVNLPGVCESFPNHPVLSEMGLPKPYWDPRSPASIGVSDGLLNAQAVKAGRVAAGE